MKIFVSASSQENISDEYTKTLIKISNIINKYDDTLLVGGTTGSMKVLLDNTNHHKVIVSKTYEDELNIYEGEFSIVDDSSLRTKMIIDEADFCIIMPGSIGTISELFTLLESKRSDGIETKLILFNLNDYYNTLIKFLNETYDKGFIKEKIEKYLYVIKEINSLKKIRSEI